MKLEEAKNLVPGQLVFLNDSHVKFIGHIHDSSNKIDKIVISRPEVVVYGTRIEVVSYEDLKLTDEKDG